MVTSEGIAGYIVGTGSNLTWPWEREREREREIKRGDMLVRALSLVGIYLQSYF